MSLSEPDGDALPRDEFGGVPELPEPEVKRTITARGAALAGARVATGLIGIGVAVVAVGAAAIVPWPTVAARPASEVVVPVPTAQQLVCPGAVLRLSDETGVGATQASALGTPTVRFAANPGTVDAAPLAVSDAGTGGTAAAPTVVSTPPGSVETVAPLLSGAQSQQLAEAEFAGLAAAECGVPTSDVWLAGGATTVGRTTLLSIANPSEVPATVNVELYGADGPIAAPGTSGIVVAPQGQRVLSIAGFQPGVAQPVVRVTSTGGQIVAALQQSTVRGLQAGGVDVVSGAASGTSLDIPGVVVPDRVPVIALISRGAGYEDLSTVIRLLAPGDQPVAATVSVIPEDAAATGTTFTLDLEGGRVTEVPVDELAAGSYTVRVTADAPVVASARSSIAVGEATDFAWASAAPVLTAAAQVTVAPGPSPRLHLSNPTGAEVAVTVGDQTVTLPAGTAGVIAVQPGQTYRLDGAAGLTAAVSYAEGASLARYPVSPPGATSGPITVYK